MSHNGTRWKSAQERIPVHIDKKEAKRMDRFTQFAVCSAKQALKMAGSDFKDVDPFKAGVIILSLIHI